MLMWNALIAWFFLVVTAAAYSPSTFESRCPRCGGPVHADGPLELLCEVGDRFLGWQTFRCARCPFRQTTLALARNRRAVLYQTHSVLT